MIGFVCLFYFSLQITQTLHMRVMFSHEVGSSHGLVLLKDNSDQIESPEFFFQFFSHMFCTYLLHTKVTCTEVYIKRQGTFVGELLSAN